MPSLLPSTHREVHVRTLPDGLPTPGDLEVVERPLPRPGAGDVLVRNRYFHVFAALRTLLGGGVEGAPFPPLRPGDAVFGPAVGQVVSAPPDGDLDPGDWVFHFAGWREYAAVAASQCRPLGDAVPDPAAHLAQGWTAYSALTRGAELKKGDVVFVSGGAGSVGSMAGQIARLLGAERVIGSTGSRDKAARMTGELGYDAVLIRGAGPIAEQLAAAAPDGIDVVVDNVGGDQLSAAIELARPEARCVLVGALSGQMSAGGTGATSPAELDTYQLILKQVTLRGFSAGSDPRAEAEWTRQFGDWLRSGRITFPHIRVGGIDGAPRALQEVIEGRHLGTVVVEL